MHNTDELAGHNALMMLEWLSDANATIGFKKDSVKVSAGLRDVEEPTLQEAIEEIVAQISGKSKEDVSFAITQDEADNQ